MIAVVAGGCAEAPKPWKKALDMYWPMPPQRPRIKMVGILAKSSDVEEEKPMEVLFGALAPTGLGKPTGVDARNGAVYVTDLNRVMVFDMDASRFRVIGGSGLGIITDVAVDSRGTVWIVDSSLAKVVGLSQDGSVRLVLKGSRNEEGRFKPFIKPSGVAIDEENERIWVTDILDNTISVFDFAGDLLFQVGGRGDGPGEFNLPHGVERCGNGEFYVLDAGNFRLQVFDQNGNYLRSFGSIGRVPGSFARPKGVACDGDGNIYIVDAAFGNFQILNNTGVPLLVVGKPGMGPGEFRLPSGIAVDEDDMVYVVDQLNRRVQIFQYLREDATTTR